jgi:hypothetical protein
MEFSVEVTADAEASGGVKFWVVELGAKGSVGRTATHTVTLELKPQTRTGGDALISDEE